MESASTVVDNSLDGIPFKKKSVKISTILPFRHASAHSVDYSKRRMSARKSLAFQDRGVLEAIKTRDKIKIVQSGIDVTPKHFGVFRFDFDVGDTVGEGISLWGIPGERRSTTSTIHADLYKSSHSFTRRTSTIDMDTMCTEIEMGGGVMEDDQEIFYDDDDSDDPDQSFLKVVLRETDDVVLYECASTTVPAESEDAAAVLEDNSKYEYLTVGKGKHRPTLDAETQTTLVLMKSVGANTERIKTENAATFVSNFEMYDTYADLERVTESVDLDTENTLQMTTYSKDGFNVIDDLLRRSKIFKFSSMVLQRLLASNIYREQQKRFRNMVMPDPLDLSIKYLYRLEPLWSYKMTETIGKGVSCLCWCHGNSDILAVGYGVYDFVPYIYRTSGYVAIWSIKNPVNPERRYRFDHPVTAVEFSKETPQLMAVGFFNGMIEVLDISDSDTDCIVARSQRNASSGFEPIWDMKWVLVGTEEELLTVSEDGLVMKYKLANGPYLLGQRQIKLDMVLGDVEGLVINNIRSVTVMDRQPQALCIETHPIHSDIFFIGTNEGCLHKCSTFIPNQYSGILRVHKGAVSGMEFSPFSPKIFLTYGSDWYIRIWIEGITQPIIELNSGFEPIRSAHWCPNNSTIIACTTKSKLNIWNIRKSILKPASTQTFESPVTICRFSTCGRSLVFGMSDGSTHCSALEDMPFPPHFQYNVLEEVVHNAIRSRPDLQLQVKILGFLGYTQDDRNKNDATEANILPPESIFRRNHSQQSVKILTILTKVSDLRPTASSKTLECSALRNSATARPAIQHCQVPIRTFQRSRSEQRPLPIIPLEAEPVRREPRQFSAYRSRGHNRVRVQSPVNNSSSTTSDSDNNDNERRRPYSHSLAKNAFCPDLLHSCPARSAQSPSSAESQQSQQLNEEDYVEIDEIRQTVSTLSIDPFNTNSTNFPHRFAEGNAICIAPIDPLKPAMGQSLSQRRPKISLTWVLRGEQQPANPSALLHVDGTENRTREKKKFRSKSKDTGERLFSEKYVTEVEKIGDAGLNNNRQRAVSELLYVCSKNAGESSSIDGYASDHCSNRNERCRRSDKPKNSSKFSLIKNNLNNFAPDKSDHFKDKTIALNGESAFRDGTRNDVKVNAEYIKPTYSEPSLCTEGQSRRHRHRRRRNRSQRFGYEIRNVDDFLSKCSLSSPGNIPVVLSSSSTLYQTKPGGYQIEIPLPLGMVVNAVFKNQNWLYVQTPHAEEGYVCYKYIMPLGIIPHMRSTSTIKPPPCWETSGFPKPCGNMTDSEKEIQLRGGTRSEGTRTPRLRRTVKQCGEKNVDLLYLRAASQPKLQEKSYAQLKSTSKICKSTTASSEKPNDDYVLLQHKKPPIYPQNNVRPASTTRNGTRSLRQTLLAVTENFVSTAISVKKGDVVTLLACKQIQDKRLQQPIQWFFVRSRDGQEGFIPAEVAGHGFL